MVLPSYSMLDRSVHAFYVAWSYVWVCLTTFSQVSLIRAHGVAQLQHAGSTDDMLEGLSTGFLCIFLDVLENDVDHTYGVAQL